MPIQTTCPSCGKPLRVPDHLIGKGVKCPGCQTTFMVEEEQPAAPPPLPPPESQYPTDAIREQPPPLPTEPLEETYREETPGRGPLPPPLPPPDKDEDEELEGNEERDYERRRRGRMKRARERLAGPAVALMVAGGLSVAYALLDAGFRIAVGAGAFAFGPPGPGGGGGGPEIMIGAVGEVLGLVLASIIIYGALEMKRVRNYGMAMAAAIIAMLPCHGCCIVGLPFGIWALVVLNDADVKAAFKQ